jgi:hypothetical protein
MAEDVKMVGWVGDFSNRSMADSVRLFELQQKI